MLWSQVPSPPAPLHAPSLLSRSVCVCVFFTLNPSAHRHPAHPVSMPISTLERYKRCGKCTNISSIQWYPVVEVCPAALCCCVLSALSSHRTTPHHTIPYHTVPYHTIPYHTIPYHTMPYHTIPYHTIPYHTIPYHTIPYHTTQTSRCLLHAPSLKCVLALGLHPTLFLLCLPTPYLPVLCAPNIYEALCLSRSIPHPLTDLEISRMVVRDEQTEQIHGLGMKRTI